MSEPGIFENVDPTCLRPNDRVRVYPTDRVKPRTMSVERVELRAIVTVVSDKSGKRSEYTTPTRFDLIVGDNPHPDEGPLTDAEIRSLQIWHGRNGARSVLQRAADEIKSLRTALYRCEADKGTT